MADPNYVFVEGFDKYGPVGTNGEQFIRSILTSGGGEWDGLSSNVSWDANFKAASPLGTTNGVSFQTVDADASLGGVNIYKTLPANYARTVGGVCFKTSSTAYITNVVFFYDIVGANVQLAIGVDTAGKLGVWRGYAAGVGTRIGTGTYTYTANTAIGVEWDVTFSNTAGIVKVWVDGVLDISISAQDTCNTANEYFNRVYLGATAYLVASVSYDHFYLWCYTAAGGTETPLGAGFQVQTAFATADSTPSQFASRRYIGNYSLTTVSGTTDTTSVVVTGPFTVSDDCQGLGVIWWPDDVITANTVYLGIYAESGGAPTTLLAQTSTSSVAVTQEPVGLYFDTPVSLTAGSKFYLAYTTNYSSSNQWRSGVTSVPSRQMTRAAFGPLPSTATALGSTYSTQMAIGLIASGFTSGKFNTVAMNPELTNYVYNYDSTVGDVDAYTFAGISGSPSAISYVALKGSLSKTNTGSRTAQLEIDSAGTIGAGTLSTPISPPVGATMYGTYFNKDPATGAAWTSGAAGAIKGRVKVVS